ncbi:MAG: TSUP family transporter [Gammaproteobacteria bacterium]|nr:TSUP family transporter [Gammaproteobacteria bacterium]
MEYIAELPLLLLIGVIAGFVDAIAGGGGLVSLPALLWAGLPPVEALATNKLQGTAGTSTATLNYMRHGLIKPRQLLLAVVCTALGAAAGAMLVQQFSNDLLSQVIPWLLICFALYFFFSPRMDGRQHPQRINLLPFSLIIGFSVGFYDGFFGPGAGSFFTLAFVLLLGYSLPHAIGGTKLLNFTSNLVALLVFLLSGKIVWVVGLAMGVGQMIGAYTGSHLAVRHGARLIRPLLVVVSVGVSIKLLM